MTDTATPTRWLASPHRLYGLCDGVFAISMTLLALEVRIPDGVPDTSAGYAEAAGDFYGLYGVFLLAFLVTGRFWLVNHRMLAALQHVDEKLLTRAVSFLAGICSIPVAMAALVRFGHVPQAVAFAGVLLAGTQLLAARLWWHLSNPANGLAEIDATTRRTVALNILYITGVYLLAIPVAFLLDATIGSSAWATLIWVLVLLDDAFTALVLRLVKRA